MTLSRSPELEEVLANAIEYYLQDLHTCMPGRIQSYDSSRQKADIQPSLQRRIRHEDGSEDVEDLPILPDVPVVFPRGAGFFLAFPLNPGDQVMLHFAHNSIDN